MSNTRTNLRSNSSRYSVEIVESRDSADPRLIELKSYVLGESNPTDCTWGSHIFEAHIPEGPVFILYFGNSIIGYARTSEFMGSEYIWYLCANHIDYKGAGTILIRSIQDYAQSRGRKSIELKSVRSATLFYKKLGFTPKGKPCGDYDVCIMEYKFQRKGGNRQRLTRRTRRSRR